MRTRRPLSRAGHEQHLARARALIEAGVAIEVAHASSATVQLLKLEAIAGADSFLFAHPSGGIGIAIWLRLVALHSGVRVSSCEIVVPWNDDGFYLQDVAKAASVYEVTHGPEYPRESVLNHQFGRNLRSGEILEGVLIARTSGKLPDVYRTRGEAVSVSLGFFDHLDNCYAVEVLLPVICDPAPKLRSRSAGLFDGKRIVTTKKVATRQTIEVGTTKGGLSDDKNTTP